MNCKLSILICTIPERKESFDDLFNELNRQCNNHNVQIIYDDAPKGTITIGAKRNGLLNKAIGEYIVYVDDDDMIEAHYVEEILKAIDKQPDCVGINIHMTTNGKDPKMCCHSLKYPIWKNNIDGFDYVRNVTHFNPVKRSLALQVMFPDISFGEDQAYSNEVTKLCKTEIYIDKVMFHYKFTNHQSHKEKYGLK